MTTKWYIHRRKKKSYMFIPKSEIARWNVGFAVPETLAEHKSRLIIMPGEKDRGKEIFKRIPVNTKRGSWQASWELICYNDSLMESILF